MAKGSQLQTRRYVNDRPRELSAAVARVFPDLAADDIHWTTPLAGERFQEPQDEEFLRAVNVFHLRDGLAAFWPKGGPVWDALATVQLSDGGHGVVLAEGKAHPAEFRGGGMKAKDPAAVEKILRALDETQKWLGLEAEPERWTGSLYQSANRYAHLYWLREVVGVPAWLVHLLFVGDETHLPTSRDEWEEALPQIEADLGLAGVSVPFAGHVFLPALQDE